MGKRKHKRGKAAKNARKGICNEESEEIVKAPHSFVINRGKIGKNGHELMMNFRKIMEPFTASKLKVQKQNVYRDFLHIAGCLHVSHFIIFNKTKNAMYVQIAKLPHGPTITFKVKKYSLMKDIISAQKKSFIYSKLFEHHPLLVLNNFSSDEIYVKLMATTFQHMFPSINVNKTNLNAIRRCLLLNYNEDKTLCLRQYAIKVVPTGMSKAVKKLILSKVPNLGKFKDIGDFLEKSVNLSESEPEVDGALNTVVLPQPISSRGNISSQKSAIRLYEIGPRLTLQMMKIEEGLMTGEFLFNEYITKTPEEVKRLKERIEAKQLLKEQGKAQQKLNVKKKLAAKENQEEKNTELVSDEDKKEDLEWYRQDVGEEPDENLLPKMLKRKSIASLKHKHAKKVKVSEDPDSNKQDSIKLANKEFTEFFKKRKQRKEAQLNKKKAKKISHAVLAMKTKQGGIARKYKSKKCK